MAKFLKKNNSSIKGEKRGKKGVTFSMKTDGKHHFSINARLKLGLTQCFPMEKLSQKNIALCNFYTQNTSDLSSSPDGREV